jgi:hypothetical protein
LQFNGNVVDRRRFVIKSNKRNALSAAAAEAAGEERAVSRRRTFGVDEKVIVEVFELQKYIKNKLKTKSKLPNLFSYELPSPV